LGNGDIRDSVVEGLSAPFLNCSYNIGKEAECPRGLYYSDSSNSDGNHLNVVEDDSAPSGVYFQTRKAVKLQSVVGPVADVFGQCSYQRLEVSLAHSTLEVGRNESLVCDPHGDEEFEGYRFSLAQFSRSCSFVKVYHQLLAKGQDLDVVGLERLVDAALVPICSSRVARQVKLH
jgi:hypothetical protein